MITLLEIRILTIEAIPKSLSSRIITRLRALIVLPTRDLVSQVRETIEVLSKGTKLKARTVCFNLPSRFLRFFL